MTKKKRIPKPIHPMIVHKLTKEESDSLKNAPRVGHIRFSENIGTATNWYDMTLRLQIGRLLVKNTSKRCEYTEEVTKVLDLALAASDEIRQRAVSVSPQVWTASDAELLRLGDGIDVVDDLQDICTRLELLKAHRQAQRLIKT